MEILHLSALWWFMFGWWGWERTTWHQHLPHSIHIQIIWVELQYMSYSIFTLFKPFSNPLRMGAGSWMRPLPSDDTTKNQGITETYFPFICHSFVLWCTVKVLIVARWIDTYSSITTVIYVTALFLYTCRVIHLMLSASGVLAVLQGIVLGSTKSVLGFIFTTDE